MLGELGDCMSKFKVGDRVKLMWDWTSQGMYREFVGQEFVIDLYDFDLLHVHSLSTIKYGKPVTFWMPKEVVEKICTEKLDLDPDRFVITLERFGVDEIRISGQVDISKDEYEYLWKTYVVG